MPKGEQRGEAEKGEAEDRCRAVDEGKRRLQRRTEEVGGLPAPEKVS